MNRAAATEAGRRSEPRQRAASSRRSEPQRAISSRQRPCAGARRAMSKPLARVMFAASRPATCKPVGARVHGCVCSCQLNTRSLARLFPRLTTLYWSESGTNLPESIQLRGRSTSPRRGRRRAAELRSSPRESTPANAGKRGAAASRRARSESRTNLNLFNYQSARPNLVLHTPANAGKQWPSERTQDEAKPHASCLVHARAKLRSERDSCRRAGT